MVHKNNLQQWSSLKSQSKKYNARKVKILSKETGNKVNEKDPFCADQLLEDVLSISGKSHGNGLPFLKEVGIKTTKQRNSIFYLLQLKLLTLITY